MRCATLICHFFPAGAKILRGGWELEIEREEDGYVQHRPP